MNYLYKSPIGFIVLSGGDEQVTGLNFISDAEALKYLEHEKPKGELLKAVVQLDEYFNNSRKTFDVKVEPQGTEFRRRVWQALLDIPYGKTISYKQLATNIGNPKAYRAVGGANHHNPISIIIPCHRVVGANGALVGYGGELWRKEWLLKHERSNPVK